MGKNIVEKSMSRINLIYFNRLNDKELDVSILQIQS